MPRQRKKVEPEPKRNKWDPAGLWDESLWVVLPTGSAIYRDDLTGEGCPKCGETIFNIYKSGDGVACPKCVRKRGEEVDGERRPPVIWGKFDRVSKTVVQVFHEVTEDRI